MVIVYGSRFYGKVKACGRSFLATRFAHIYYVPLIPIGTSLVLEENADGSYRGMKAPFSVKSMLAAYLRVWGPLACIATFFLGLGAVEDMDGEPVAMIVAGVFSGVVFLALLAGTILGWAVVGKLSEDEKKQRSVYAMHLGYFVDPADMGDARHAFRDGLLETIANRARGMASMGYRMSADPVQAWPHLALDPTHNDDQLVTAAFTLARLDASLAQGGHKLQLEQLHQQIWQRIQRANPPYLTAHAGA